MGAEHTLPGEESGGGWTTRPWWAAARRTFWTVFGLLTLVLIVRLGSEWDWTGAFETLKRVPAVVLGPALICAAVAHLLYAGYELLGRPMAPPRRRVGEKPVAMEKGLRFAVREGGRTIGSGVVTEILE